MMRPNARSKKRFLIKALTALVVLGLIAAGTLVYLRWQHSAQLAERLDAGKRALTNGDLDNAHAEFSEAIQLAPNRAEAYQGRGAVFLRQRKWNEAIADCDQALKLSEDA